MNQPEILIVGAGGMGALFGSILHENGLKVVLYDTNTEHIRAIQQAGLKIEGYGGDRTIPIAATSNLSELESAEIIIFSASHMAPAKPQKQSDLLSLKKVFASVSRTGWATRK